MSLAFNQTSDLPEWQNLQQHYNSVGSGFVLKKAFDEDSRRFEKFNWDFHNTEDGTDILFDLSKNLVNDETVDLLIKLAQAAGVEKLRGDMVALEEVNFTEKKAASHMALRDFSNPVPKVHVELERMREFSDKVRNGEWKGYTGKRIQTIINIGIGGSDLGPQTVCEALKPYGDRRLKLHFVSNIDGTHLAEALEESSPETTLFLISSKSFTTAETLLNARSALSWFLSLAKDRAHMAQHFIGISARVKEVEAFGISERNTFLFDESVGGRFSVWSTIGLSICLYIGYEQWCSFLKGAHLMDLHFRNTPLKDNIPVLSGLINVWYTSFHGTESHLVSPYDQYLWRFAAYLQQVSMESNGKSVTRGGDRVKYATAPVVFGEPGTNGQHSYHQLLYQGTILIPTDLIVPVESHNPLAGNQHHKMLVANCLAQAEALMMGSSISAASADPGDVANAGAVSNLAAHEYSPGNRPTTLILAQKISPSTLGALIAYYEHVTFTEGAIWNINSFDNYGPDLPKECAQTLLDELESAGPSNAHDQSTRALLNRFKQRAGIP